MTSEVLNTKVTADAIQRCSVCYINKIYVKIRVLWKIHLFQFGPKFHLSFISFIFIHFYLVRGCSSSWIIQFSSVAKSSPTLCDPMNCSTPGLPVHHHFQSPPTPMSIMLVMPFNHLILCCPLLFLPSIFPSIRIIKQN